MFLETKYHILMFHWLLPNTLKIYIFNTIKIMFFQSPDWTRNWSDNETLSEHLWYELLVLFIIINFNLFSNSTCN